MLKEADKIKCRVFLTPEGVVKGTYNLNLAFVAHLFNCYPALEMPDMEVEVVEETREEKSTLVDFLAWLAFAAGFTRCLPAFLSRSIHVT